MEKCIAIPLERGVLCPHFGHCEEFAILKTKEQEIVDETTVTPPEHQPGLYPGWIAQFGVTDVIAGGMGQRAIDLFHQQKINVFVGAPVQNARELVMSFLQDKLELQSNYCDH
jgi:predicted Fe-Mo cluster-binding NifX family protein